MHRSRGVLGCYREMSMRGEILKCDFEALVILNFIWMKSPGRREHQRYLRRALHIRSGV